MLLEKSHICQNAGTLIFNWNKALAFAIESRFDMLFSSITIVLEELNKTAPSVAALDLRTTTCFYPQNSVPQICFTKISWIR